MTKHLTYGLLLPCLMLLAAPYSASAQEWAPPRDCALVRVVVPDPQARLWIGDTATRQHEMRRCFVSPPLQTGVKYWYDLRVTWQENGKRHTEKRRVDVRPGKEIVVDFTQPVPSLPKDDWDRPLTPPIAPEPGT